MRVRLLQLLCLVFVLTSCGWGQSDVAPDKLVGKTIELTLESGAFPSSGIAMQLVSSKDLVWRLDGNLGQQTGSSDYLISMVNKHTMLVTWRSDEDNYSYVVTLDFATEHCFLVRVDGRQNLLSEGVFAIE